MYFSVVKSAADSYLTSLSAQRIYRALLLSKRYVNKVRHSSRLTLM